ncbi:MAG: hypothetical protein ACE5IF_03560 [Candidatus Bathyarchaeia archaeon]
MDYRKMVEIVPIEKREKLSVKLIDLILKSKNAEKMPSSLAKTILHHWQQGPLTNEIGLAALLKAAVILESEKTMNFLGEELQLSDIVKAIKAVE